MALEAIDQTRGDWKSPAAWLSACGLSPEDTPDFSHQIEYFLFAAILVRQGKLDEASQILGRLQEVLEHAGANTLVIKILVDQAIIAYTKGDDEGALSSLQCALQLAEPEGFIRAFLSKGRRMEQLLRKAVTAGISPDYARMLLEKFASPGENILFGTLPAYPIQVGKDDQALIEPLSERELQVLRLSIPAWIAMKSQPSWLYRSARCAHTSRIFTASWMSTGACRLCL